LGYSCTEVRTLCREKGEVYFSYVMGNSLGEFGFIIYRADDGERNFVLIYIFFGVLGGPRYLRAYAMIEEGSSL